MATIRKILSGSAARRNGLAFEALLMHSAFKQGWYSMKIPDGCRSANGRLIRVATAFDFVLAKNGTAIFIDAKSTSSANFSYAQITHHQAESLKRFEEQGLAAGYVVMFTEKNEARFYSASQLIALRPRCSLRPDDGTYLGSASLLDIDAITRCNPIP